MPTFGKAAFVGCDLERAVGRTTMFWSVRKQHLLDLVLGEPDLACARWTIADKLVHVLTENKGHPSRPERREPAPWTYLAARLAPG
ncbi:hypothetical protein O5282_26955 [Escherichia coli]|nr:hypothetical protein [Escherichia coli]